jgi:hypothetical protein
VTSRQAPANHHGFDAGVRLRASPGAIAPSTQERNDVSPDVILAKQFERLVCRWHAFMIEGVNALLSRCHAFKIRKALVSALRILVAGSRTTKRAPGIRTVIAGTTPCRPPSTSPCRAVATAPPLGLAARQNVDCSSPHSSHLYGTRVSPLAARTRFNLPHFRHLLSIRVLPRVTVRDLRSNASLTRRSASSRIACFDISRFLALSGIGHTDPHEPRQRVLKALKNQAHRRTGAMRPRHGHPFLPKSVRRLLSLHRRQGATLFLALAEWSGLVYKAIVL